MPTIERFEDIEAWQKARVLVRAVYRASSRSPFARDFGLRDQMQKAAVSIMSNIAEGFERASNKEFVQFLNYAKGSAGEVRSQLYVALDLGYIDEGEFDRLMGVVLAVSKKLSGFMTYLKSEAQRHRP